MPKGATPTPKQAIFVAELAKGRTQAQAATKAGYGKYVARNPSAILRSPMVQEMIKDVRQTLAKDHANGADESIAQINRMIEIELENPRCSMMAIKGLIELRCKIKGLLIERVEVASVDLTGALQRAEARASLAPVLPPLAIDTVAVAV